MSNWIISKTWRPKVRVAWGKRTTPETVYKIVADRDEALAEYRKLAAEDAEFAKKHGGRGASDPRWSFTATGRAVTDGWVNTKLEARKAQRAKSRARRKAAK